jgi:hypothetical protein
MADLIVLLGDFIFQENEIPASINFGGSQALGVHQLIGGARVVDSMGNVDSDITWSGLFFNNITTGLSAIDRAKELNILRTLGLELPFIFYDLIYLVKIKEFLPVFERFYQVPYRITLQVIQDLNIPNQVSGQTSFLSAIVNDLNVAEDAASFINDPTLNGLITAFGTALGSAGTLTNASPSVLNGLINASSACSARAGVLANQFKNNLSGV